MPRRVGSARAVKVALSRSELEGINFTVRLNNLLVKYGEDRGPVNPSFQVFLTAYAFRVAIRRIRWVELLHQASEVDVFDCYLCHGRLQRIAWITEAKSIKTIRECVERK